MKKFLAIAALALPLVGAIITGMVIANTDYPHQVVEAQIHTLFQTHDSMENVNPHLFSMLQVIDLHENEKPLGMETLLIARSNK